MSDICPGPSAPADTVAEVRGNAPVADGLWQMDLAAPSLARGFAPGQFLMLLAAPEPGSGPFLRRPFAPSTHGPDGFSFVYAIRGEGTRLMATFMPGREVRVLAPLGRGYALPEEPGAPAILAGGGCGLASLGPLALALRDAGHPVRSVAGAARAGALAGLAPLEAAGPVAVATDDGSRGWRGTVADALRRVLDEPEAAGTGAPAPVVYACGPRGMLAAVAALAAERGLPCQVSLEERMACGFGACMGCAVAVHAPGRPGGIRYARVCHEGPVFKARDVVW